MCDPNVMQLINNYSSKLTYLRIMAKKYYKPICENKHQELPWPGLYKRVVGKFLCSELRCLNYRIIMEGLSFGLKYYKN